MTENTELNAVVGPQVRVAVDGDDDWQFAFSELDEYNHHDPATISDDDMIKLVADYRDITVESLKAAVLGDHRGNVVVGKPETGNVVIRPETKLG